MDWLIVSDSSCDIRSLDVTAPNVSFSLVPFKINIGAQEFVDTPDLDTEAISSNIFASTRRSPRVL